jgi:putative transposase
MRPLQEDAALHASVNNHFNQNRECTSRRLFKANSAAALAEWRGLCGG